MSGLISKNALMKEFEIQEFIKNDRLFDIPQIKAFIEEQPTVEPVRGEWVMRGGKAYCSKCGKLALMDKDRDDWCYHKQSDWCPHCGADMGRRLKND